MALVRLPRRVGIRARDPRAAVGAKSGGCAETRGYDRRIRRPCQCGGSADRTRAAAPTSDPAHAPARYAGCGWPARGSRIGSAATACRGNDARTRDGLVGGGAAREGTTADSPAVARRSARDQAPRRLACRGRFELAHGRSHGERTAVPRLGRAQPVRGCSAGAVCAASAGGGRHRSRDWARRQGRALGESSRRAAR